MKTLTLGSAFVASAALLAVSASTAGAVSISIGGTSVAGEGYKSNVAGATTIDFNSGAAPTSGMVSYSGVTNHIVQGNRGGHHATPAGDTTKYLTLSRAGAGVAGSTGALTLDFAKALDYFGLYWGSVDTYNYLDIFKGNTLLRTISGRDVSATPNGGWTGSATNKFVNLYADAGESFDRVVMRSTGVAFETDNHAFKQAVPEPFTVGGSLVGLAMGWKMRRKQQAKKAEA